MSISGRKHMPEPVRRIEVFTGAGRRRTWSTAEKAAIVAESYGGGETVCAVARRHGLTPQQLFTWRRLARSAASQPEALFVPAVVETGSEAAAPARPRCAKASAVEIEIGGAVVRFGAQASRELITAVLHALKSAP
jgi:transposase